MSSARWSLPLFLLLCLVGRAQDSERLAAADTLFAHENWKGARKLYDEEIRRGNATANVHYQRARCSRMLGLDWEVVFSDLTEALRSEPRHFKAMLMRGVLYFDNLMFERSVDDLSEALSFAPDTAGMVRCLTERGAAYSAMRSFEKGAEDFRRALKLDSTAYAAYGRLANALNDLGQHEEALAMQIRYTEHVPDDYIGYMNVGFYLAEAGRYEEALTWYGKAMEHTTKEKALVLNNRGYVKYKLGDNEAALKDIREGLELMHWNAYGYRNLALVLLAQGKTDEACTAMEKALHWGFTSRYGDEVKKLHDKVCK